MNWSGQQANLLGNTENDLAPGVVVNDDTTNRYHHPYMSLSPMAHYHHGAEYLPEAYLHEHAYHGHHLPHHYYEPDPYYSYHPHTHHELGIHHGLPDYGHHLIHEDDSHIHDVAFSKGMHFQDKGFVTP